MMKTFNTEAICIPEYNYMVDLSDRLGMIRRMIEDRKYFIINKGRQYGKTTMLYMLKQYISDEYAVLSISFESADDLFVDRLGFVNGFIRKINRELTRRNTSDTIERGWNAYVPDKLCWEELNDRISWLCDAMEKPVVLMIDEVDKSSDNQIFLSFLGLLRDKYIERQKSGESTFHSVILAGVYDIRNLKVKLRPEEDHKRNSPWNIAAPFNVDMDFSVQDIEGMLAEYQNDHGIQMDLHAVSSEIRAYTGGYPFLVSLLCRCLDESGGDWNREGISTAVKKILTMKLPLFDSLINNLTDYPDMAVLVRRILLEGDVVADNPDDPGFDMAKMFGFLKSEDGTLRVSNRIFETRLYNYFISSSDMQQEEIFRKGSEEKKDYVIKGRLDMDKVVSDFVRIFDEIYGDRRQSFIEEEGRRYFLLFLKPIINGVGNYYVEAQTRDRTRTDIIVDYLGEQYVIELKIWHGEEYNSRGEKQLADYLDYYKADKGWMVSFCFNKNKVPGTKSISIGGKVIFEGIV
ncbi:MAG: AAA-like domain-containing protein [Lachnospiraceae bacterium]|nr:AAA-like domain-containing protein [Lachnospiraceae bacterium]